MALEKYLILHFPAGKWTGGLGDRIVGMVSMQVLAGLMQRKFLIHWEFPDIKNYLSINPKYDMQYHLAPKDSRDTLHWNLIDDDRHSLKSFFQTQNLLQESLPKYIICHCNQEILTQIWNGNPFHLRVPSEQCEILHQAYAHIFQDILIPKPRLLTKCIELLNPAFKKTLVLQLRTGDHSMGAGFQCLINVHALETIITEWKPVIEEKYPPDKFNIYWTSDYECVDLIRKIFENYTVIYCPGDIVHFERQSGNLEKQLIDYLACFMADAIIFSFASNFGRTATLISKYSHSANQEQYMAIEPYTGKLITVQLQDIFAKTKGYG